MEQTFFRGKAQTNTRKEATAMGRRGFLELAGASALLASGGCACPCGEKPLCEYDDELIDRCWLWGHETGQVDGPNNGWKLDAAKTYYHMADAAKFMGLRNLNAIRWDKPSRAFRDSLRGLKRVTWPMSGNKTELNYTYDALAEWNFAAADEMPNVTGFDLDDFFVARGQPVLVDTPKGRRMSCPTRFPFAQLVELRRRLDAYPRRLELRAVVYDELFDQRKDPIDLVPALELADSVTFWNWHAVNMKKQPEYFSRYKALVPNKRTYLGVYLWDFGGHQPMPAGAIEMQLEMGLDFFRRGEIEGFVFLCSSICNRPLPTVAYVRSWLARHGGERRS